MRVLILTPALPYPLHQGGAIRNYGVIHGLRKAGHEITLLSFCDESVSAQSTPLGELCREIRTVPFPVRSMRQRLQDLLFSNHPDLTRRLLDERFAQCLDELLAESRYDLIQLAGLEMASHLELIRKRQPQAKVCYDAHNAEHALQSDILRQDRRNLLRWPAAAYSLIQARRLTRFERKTCREVDLVVSVSQEDANALRRLRANTPIAIVPNGIFVDDYTQPGEKLDLGENVLVFTGKMDYRPNIDAMLWFGNDILPQIHQHIPNTLLYIVGQKPHPRLDTLRDKEHIKITGWVAEVQPYFNAADVYVAPLRMGSGTRLKILQAMASGCAVVATSTAASGLLANGQQAMIIANDESDTKQAIVGLLQNREARDVLGASAREFARKYYDWTALIPDLLAAYEEIGLG